MAGPRLDQEWNLTVKMKQLKGFQWWRFQKNLQPEKTLPKVINPQQNKMLLQIPLDGLC